MKWGEKRSDKKYEWLIRLLFPGDITYPASGTSGTAPGRHQDSYHTPMPGESPNKIKSPLREINRNNLRHINRPKHFHLHFIQGILPNQHEFHKAYNQLKKSRNDL